jgi:hypothetical protein
MTQRPFVALCAIAVLALSFVRDANALRHGIPDFAHPAVGALLVHQPGALRGDWGELCSGFLIHGRVFMTAGHCTHRAIAALDAGVFLGARVSFQQDPFDPATYVEGDPDASGWLEIERIITNPDGPDWSNPPEIIANWGNWHDQGAVILAEPVRDFRPLRLPRFVGQVELMTTLQCERLAHVAGFCELLLVAYGVHEWPTLLIPNYRQSARTNYLGIDSLFLHTVDEPGDACPGDSGGAVIMKSGLWGSEVAIAVLSSPSDPFVFCVGPSLQYRLDTQSSLRFIWETIIAVEWEDFLKRLREGRHHGSLDEPL